MGIQIFEQTSYLMNRLFPHYIYLNGEKISISVKEFENDEIDKINLNLIREKLGNKIPNDSRFIYERDEEIEIDKEKEKNMGNYYMSFLGFDLFSKSLYNNNWVVLNKNPFENLKVLETKKNLIIYEYPQKKEENDFFTILLLGGNNFVNGFLNYLFDIKIDDEYRLKLEEFEQEKKQFIIKKYIQCPKGNFKFVIVDPLDYYSLNVEDINKIIQTLNEEKNINLFAVNIIVDSGKYQDIISQIIDIKFDGKQEKSELFFIEPNDIYLYIKSSYYAHKTNIDKSERINKINSEIMEETEKIFPSNIIFPDFIYENDNNATKKLKCTYNKMHYGYSNFYNAVIQRKNKIIDFSNIISYLTFAKEKFNVINLKIRQLDEKIKQIKEANKNVKDEVMQYKKKRIIDKEIVEYNGGIALNKFKTELKMKELK